MWSISIKIEKHPVFTASHILADLRIVTEALFYPLRQVGFWDEQADGLHLCPQESRRTPCPHKLPNSDPNYVSYADTAAKDMKAILEVYFPHSNAYLYLR